MLPGIIPTSMLEAMTYVQDKSLFRAPAFTVAQFTLFESRQGKAEPAYIPLADYRLVGASEI